MITRLTVGPLAHARRWFRDGLRDETRRFVNSSAVVFAPHQDDESLGCGGTIALKALAGTPVQLVFMTDGCTSHRRFMAPEALAELRNSEALRAAQVLGLWPGCVSFLNYPDSQLEHHHQSAVSKVIDVLNRRRPEEVFVPYRADGTPDHEATFRIVYDAVQRVGFSVRVCEYPVWFWNRWPWVALTLEPNRGAIHEAWRSVRSGCGWTLLRTFRSGVRIGEVLARKRGALDQHKSQTTRLVEGVGWPILSDVARGEFLQCFFQEFEAFHCWENVPAHGRNGQTPSNRQS